MVINWGYLGIKLSKCLLLKNGVETVYNVLNSEEDENGNFIISKLWRKDNNENELKPQQVEVNSAKTGSPFRDSMGYITEPFEFYFEKGVNTITLDAVKETLLIDKLIVESVKGGTVAVRCPGDAWLRKVIEETGIIYSTSVNRSGSSVLEECSQIIEEFNNEVELIVCDGDKINSLPSTIVSYVNSEIKIIRQGSLNINI